MPQPHENRFDNVITQIREQYQIDHTDEGLNTKSHIVQTVTHDTHQDPIDVANAVAWYDASTTGCGHVQIDQSNSHLIVIHDLKTRHRRYFSVADILQLVPSIYAEPSPVPNFPAKSRSGR